MFVLPHSRAVHPALRQREAADSLARVVDHLFASVAPPRAAGPAARTPALDVSETDTHYLLSFELPGADKAALKVLVQGRRVELETVEAPPPAEPTAAETSAPAAAQAPAPSVPRSLYRERLGTRYARTVSLPQEVDSDTSEARFEQGVLTLSLAKRRPDGARRLTVS